MQFYKNLILGGVILSILSLSSIATASTTPPTNTTIGEHQMGDFISPETHSTVAPNTRVKVFGSAASAAPNDLFSNDTSLPRQDVVDIASHQSWMTQADFNQLKADGVKTIVIKLTEEISYTNPYAAKQIQMAKAAGLNVAAYHFAWFPYSQDPTNQSEANKEAALEAKYFASVAQSLGLPGNTVMVEDAEASYGPTKIWTQASQIFTQTLNSLGYSNVKYYTSQTWLNDGKINPNTLGSKNMWVAQYLYGKPSASNLQNTQYGAWQYTSQMFFQGTANLQNNRLDTSIDYNNIFGANNSNLSDVYRLYNPNTGEHFYTQNYSENLNLQNVGWRSEGIGWKTSSSGSPIYRLYNPNAKGGDHYYTVSKYEAQQLVNQGWKWDNNGNPVFYSSGPKNLYVAYNPNASSGSHNYTISIFEQNNLLQSGWKYGAVAWKVN